MHLWSLLTNSKFYNAHFRNAFYMILTFNSLVYTVIFMISKTVNSKGENRRRK